MSNLPSKQAALSGVEFVFVGWFTSAPAFTNSLHIFRWPIYVKQRKSDIIKKMCWPPIYNVGVIYRWWHLFKISEDTLNFNIM